MKGKNLNFCGSRNSNIILYCKKIKFKVDNGLLVVYNLHCKQGKAKQKKGSNNMKKSALVWNGKEYKEMVVDDTMTKTLVFGRICYVLNDVKTFPSVDTEQSFGTTTKENVWVRFSFDCSARVDLRELVRYAVGCDRFGGLPLRFRSHSGKLTITTCRCGKLAGASKFLLRAMNESAFNLNKVAIEFIDGNGKLPSKVVTWSRKQCEEFACNTDITHAIQALRKEYSEGRL